MVATTCEEIRRSRGVLRVDRYGSPADTRATPSSWPSSGPALPTASAPTTPVRMPSPSSCAVSIGSMYQMVEVAVPRALFARTLAGSNGSCGAQLDATYYICHGVIGYDGPTGLVTPNGTGEF